MKAMKQAAKKKPAAAKKADEGQEGEEEDAEDAADEEEDEPTDGEEDLTEVGRKVGTFEEHSARHFPSWDRHSFDSNHYL